VANKATQAFVKTGSGGRFFNPSNGQFVSNNLVKTVTATRDATRVILPQVLGF
jgi:hypothetical protein